MSSFESLFSSASLDVAVPETDFAEPPFDQSKTDEWLSRLSSERPQAFYDETLQSLLLVRISHPTPNASPDMAHPPKELLAFLSHLQISLEASYISSAVPTVSEFPEIKSATLAAPPRPTSLLIPPATAGGRPPRSASTTAPHHPSIFPPATPNPTPFTAEQDRRYLNSQGTPLLAIFWGQNTAQDSREAFWLLWSEKEETWVAVYRLAFTVAFIRLAYSDPLLCLTISTTLRDKAVNVANAPKHPLASFLSKHSYPLVPETPATGTLPPSGATTPLPSVTVAEDGEKKLLMGEPQKLNGLQEVNIFQGLASGPSFQSSDLTLSSTRLGSISRQKLFLLPPVAPPTPVFPSPSPMTAVRTAAPTMRKSYRKTLGAVSGFRVRMRTVFVPAFMLPPKRSASNMDSRDADDIEEKKDDDSGSDERTVVLCVEIENSGEAGETSGFEVERVLVKIASTPNISKAQAYQAQLKDKDKRGAEQVEAEARLIGWGDADADGEDKTFPLTIGALEQYNLLYAVTFLRNPAEDLDMVSSSSGAPGGGGPPEGLQRAVGIEIFGRPCNVSADGTKKVSSYPTRTFSSKWNCILDLSNSAAQQQQHTQLLGEDGDSPANGHVMNVLPEPGSPFPGGGVTSPKMQMPMSAGGASSGGYSQQTLDSRESITPKTGMHAPGSAGKRHTMPPGSGTGLSAGSILAARAMGAGQMRPNSTSVLDPRSGGGGQRHSSILPPSVSAALQIPRSPTTYAPPTPPPGAQQQRFFTESPPPQSHNSSSTAGADPMSMMSPPLPQTPAYPAFPSDSALPPSPTSMGPRIGGSTNAMHYAAQHNSNANGTNAVEIRRERGTGMGGAGGFGYFGSGGGGLASGKVPQTPAPIVSTSVGGHAGWGGQSFFDTAADAEAPMDDIGMGGGDNQVVVSIGLLPTAPFPSVGEEEGNKKTVPGRIMPLDHFTLDIFVFNQSSWTRRLEIGCPVDSRRRRGAVGRGGDKRAARKPIGGGGGGGSFGVLPIENRVRVGPLRPSTCQSVRMKFMAVTPGVHTIDSLTLTDVESGFVMNLRSVMDIVVHEPD